MPIADQIKDNRAVMPGGSKAEIIGAGSRVAEVASLADKVETEARAGNRATVTTKPARNQACKTVPEGRLPATPLEMPLFEMSLLQRLATPVPPRSLNRCPEIGDKSRAPFFVSGGPGQPWLQTHWQSTGGHSPRAEVPAFLIDPPVVSRAAR